MPIPAWQIIAWDQVTTTVDEFDRAVTKLRHLATSVHGDDADSGLKHGQVLWGAEADGKMIGLAWDWAEVREDVIAMTDPMRVLSNLQLVAGDGSRLRESERLLHLNCAIHELRWQRHLARNQAPMLRAAA